MFCNYSSVSCDLQKNMYRKDKRICSKKQVNQRYFRLAEVASFIRFERIIYLSKEYSKKNERIILNSNLFLLFKSTLIGLVNNCPQMF